MDISEQRSPRSRAPHGRRTGSPTAARGVSWGQAQLARVLAALVCAVLLIAAPVGIGAASADPAPTPNGGGAGSPVSAGSLPEGFPAELRQFVGGTEEFKRGSWFSGPCADRGGDIGGYINATLPAEGKLLYWSQSEEDRKKNGADRKELPSFPSGDSKFFMPPGTCVNDIKQFGATTLSVWGFDFAKTPDKQSLEKMAGRLGVAKPGFLDGVLTQLQGPAAKLVGDVVDPKFDPANLNADKAVGPFKAHAFFLDCGAAPAAPIGQVEQCRNWNNSVATLFQGTFNWIVANMSLSDRITKSWDKNTAPYVQAWNTLYGAAKTLKKFVEDPTSFADDWANSMKEWAMGMAPKVLKGLASVGKFDYTTPGFMAWYSISITLGWLVMAIMLLITIAAGSRDNIPITEVIKSVFAYAPATLIFMAALPLVLSTLVLPVSYGLTDFLSQKLGTTTDETIASLNTMFQGLNKDTVLGGALSGLLGYGAMGIGAFTMYLGLMMHWIAVPLGTIACGISLGMYVNPRMRAKALRPLLSLIALIFAKPLLFLVLGVAMWLMKVASGGSITGDGEVKSLGLLLFVAMLFIVIGFSPFTLLKWAPVLPSGEDAPGFSSQGGTVLGAAAGGAFGSHAARSVMNRFGSGGGGRSFGGSSGGGGGGSSRGSGGAPGQGALAAANSGASGSGAGRSGRVGGHGQRFLSVARTGSKVARTGLSAVGGPLAAAAMVTGSGASAAVRKARTDIESASARGFNR